jgi:hypothetical protein
VHEVWFVELHREPNNCVAVFGHWSRAGGRHLWGSVPWMAPVDPVTEVETLQELYTAICDLMEARQALA